MNCKSSCEHADLRQSDPARRSAWLLPRVTVPRALEDATATAASRWRQSPAHKVAGADSAARGNAPRPASFPDRILRRHVLARLGELRSGQLRVREQGVEDDWLGGADTELGGVCLTVHDPAFYRAVAARGALGAGESWVAGQWSCDDLPTLVRMLVRDRQVLDGLDSGLAVLSRPLLRLWHAMRSNTRAGSRRNITAHYDLGNDFFGCFLDPSLTYSSALFERPDEDLEPAQQRKLARLCQLLELQPGEHLLEIGTGWGSMALHAARHHGVRVTTTTISPRQWELARERVRAAGLDDRVEVLLCDYRDLRGTYDKVVSVEMVEAVGDRFLPGYFGNCSRLLRPGGRLALQAITIADQHYQRALRTVDFIKRHVFPGSFIPSTTRLLTAATSGSDLRLRALDDFGDHYAETLRRWRSRLHANADRILDLGYPQRLFRAWDYYFAYCEGGFAEGYLGLCQLRLDKPAT
ncbi:MAG: class I SAM-dependent methyltransferase [Planctomycetes bacterium]|nr:class I SAM-dependent methyltransferase [Planctomycetota bacterium]